jgi:hypothetical protein
MFWSEKMEIEMKNNQAIDQRRIQISGSWSCEERGKRRVYSLARQAQLIHLLRESAEPVRCDIEADVRPVEIAEVAIAG